MSIDISSSNNESGKSAGRGGIGSSGGVGGGGLYETKTLMCKNSCGYYGNSIQYDGYCSICYRKLKSSRAAAAAAAAASSNNLSYLMSSSASFDDSSSLVSNSFNHNNRNNKNLYDDRSKENENSKNNQFWNDHTNLNKFVSKKDVRRGSSSSSAFKFLRRPSTSTIAAAVDTVTKVADKAVNMVDQSLNPNSLNSINENSSNHHHNNNHHHSHSFSSLSIPGSFSSLVSLNSLNSETNLIEFNNCVNRLVTSPTTSSTISSSMLTNNNNSNNNSTKSSKSNKLDANNSNLPTTSLPVLADFEEQFKLNFPQLNQDLNKQMKQFVEKFLEAFKRKDQQQPTSLTSNKQFEIVQDFYKKVYKYILSSASIKTYLDKSAAIKAASAAANMSASSNLNDSSSLNSYESTNLQQINTEDADKLYEAIMILVESYITNNIYDYTFPSIMTEFEEQDMNLQKRIRSFYWISNDMIGTCIDENSIFYRDSYEEAINYIVEMDSKRTAHEKMLCITECSKNIYKAINISATIQRSLNEPSTPALTSSPNSQITTPTNEESPGDFNIDHDDSTTMNNDNVNKTSKNSTKSIASADDYLPAFIYIVLKANPTMLYSNMNFISRFAFEKRVLQGEHAYHFCSLNAIITHIENLNAQHLNMSEEQFENYCNGLVDINSSSNVLKLIESNLKMLSELKNKQKLLRKETLKLQNEMNLFKQSMQTKFHLCLDMNKEKLTQNVNGYERRSVLDDNKDILLLNQTKLPEPLKPSSINNQTNNNNNNNYNKTINEFAANNKNEK